MQAVMETIFDVIYLTTVISLGIIMIRKSRGSMQYQILGIMAVILGAGDSFHLIPRAVALCTTGLENYTQALGIGKLVTSITMTIFYILLYHIWKMRYHVTGKNILTAVVYLLAVLRIILCLMPQNQWTSANAPLQWGIYRNIPFAALGLLIIILFWKKTRNGKDRSFRFIWLTITLSFAFYIPVVLFSDRFPAAGMLMIPKTCAYVWTVMIGFLDMTF